MPDFYNLNKINSMLDLKGNKPEIYIITSNRAAGKTTATTKMCIKRFINNGEKFGFLYRFDYELKDCHSKIFDEVGRLFFPEYVMGSERKMNGKYYDLYLIKKGSDIKQYCGCAIAINASDVIKKNAAHFCDIERLVFDEFQSEVNNYCINEITKFRSIHQTIARGGGKQSRRVPVYMLSNPVSLINPYYTALHISERLSNETKFLRGNGWVLEQGYNKSASDALKASSFEQAFEDDKYSAYSSQGVYLNDSMAFIEKPSGRSRYLATLKYNDKEYAVRAFDEKGFIYCDDKADKTYPYKIALTTEDHNINYVMIKSNNSFIMNMRYYFEHGCFRFKDLKCKEVIMTALSY